LVATGSEIDESKCAIRADARLRVTQHVFKVFALCRDEVSA
jgi:hypothetical protein